MPYEAVYFYYEYCSPKYRDSNPKMPAGMLPWTILSTLHLIRWCSCAPVAGHSHNCLHDTLVHHPPTVSAQRVHARGRETQQSAIAPIRVVFNTETLVDDVYSCYSPGQRVLVGTPASAQDVCSADLQENCYLDCTENHVLDATRKNWLTTQLLPAVASWFGAALRIIEPVAAPLVVAPQPCGFGGDIQIPDHIFTDGRVEFSFHVWQRVELGRFGPAITRGSPLAEQQPRDAFGRTRLDVLDLFSSFRPLRLCCAQERSDRRAHVCDCSPHPGHCPCLRWPLPGGRRKRGAARRMMNR